MFYHFTCMEQKTPDKSDVYKSFQNCGPSISNLFPVILLACRIWRWLLKSWKVCTPLELLRNLFFRIWCSVAGLVFLCVLKKQSAFIFNGWGVCGHLHGPLKSSRVLFLQNVWNPYHCNIPWCVRRPECLTFPLFTCNCRNRFAFCNSVGKRRQRNDDIHSSSHV